MSAQTGEASGSQNPNTPDSKDVVLGFPPKSSLVLYGEPVMPLPHVKDGAEFVKQMRGMTMRNDDILLLAFPKCGTHWVAEIIGMLRKGKAELDERTKEHMMLEFGSPSVFDEEPSPRLFNSHLHMPHLPVETFSKKIKLVHVYRNPKDTLVSFYHHFLSMDLIPEAMTFDHFIDIYIANDLFGGHQFSYLRQLSKFTNENPDYPILHIRYEDLKKNPGPVVKEIASFLELEPSDEFVSQVVEACDFVKMKEANSERKSPERCVKIARGKEPNIYRQGNSGGWKQALTEAQIERIDAFIAKESTDLQEFPFIYS